MSSETPIGKVLIVGAGLAGLALAQGLKHASPSIPFRIFERDSSPKFRAQGYRIRISPEGAAGLQKVLPTHLWEAFEATCAPVPEVLGSRLDARSGEPVEWPSPSPASGGPMRQGPQLGDGKSYNADRTVLRNILLGGLEDDVEFGKEFVDFTANSDGTVQVRFTDGSTADGGVLIGADGIRSGVRRQLLPQFTLLDSEGRAIFGKTLLTPEVRDNVPSKLEKEMCLIGEGPNIGIKLLCDSMKFTHPGFDESLKARFKVPEEYIYWVLVFRKDYNPGDDSTLLRTTREEARQLSLQLTESWHQSIRALFEHQEVDATSALSFNTCSVDTFVKQWESLESPNSQDSGPVTLTKGPITLLGDAAHPMTPVGGVGANTAFQEAADLFKALTKAFSNSWKLDDALMAYQGLMTERGKTVIGRSHMGAGHFFGMRPIEELKPVGEK
ncbi:hypothetical protein BGZ63DRAFT_426680 [Mariannaea sp. PMI_226]|nr:hypothetical protein BGZ63DRAFT_426680 [Mariannaea sp. PMI_226]